MGGLKPDTDVFTQIRSQPEFNQQLWQYLNRRVSGLAHRDRQESAKTYVSLFARIDKDFGVERAVMLGLWGIESTFGDPVVKQNDSRPIFPALAALAWGEPRRRSYWETELINALRIVEKGGQRQGHGRAPGRRDGAHPVDAGSLAQRRHRR